MYKNSFKSLIRTRYVSIKANESNQTIDRD